MTLIDWRSPSRGVAATLIVGLAGALLLAAPAQAQRTSLDSLAADHDDILGNQNHGATPIFACTTIDQPGSYVVVQNLVAVGGDCLFVTADDVTIDLGGHVLTGDGTGAGAIRTNGSAATPRQRITVRNGSVTGFVRGVALGFVERAVVDGVHAFGNGQTGILVASDSRVTNSTARDNGANGISAGGTGSTIAGNMVRDNAVRGITSGASTAVTDNIVSSSEQIGIFAGNGSVVAGNVVSGNGSDGINARQDSIVTGNTARDNGRFGIFADHGSRVSGNSARGNVDNGIHVLRGVTVVNNSAFTNGNAGIFVGFGGTVAGNTARDNGGNGIAVNCPSNVIGNTATDNALANLDLNFPGCNNVNNVAP